MWAASAAQDAGPGQPWWDCVTVKCRNLGLVEVKPLPELLTPQ